MAQLLEHVAHLADLLSVACGQLPALDHQIVLKPDADVPAQNDSMVPSGN